MIPQCINCYSKIYDQYTYVSESDGVFTDSKILPYCTSLLGLCHIIFTKMSSNLSCIAIEQNIVIDLSNVLIY